MSLNSGNYDKWVASGEDNNYLPHWIKKAGYRAECELPKTSQNARHRDGKMLAEKGMLSSN